VVRRMSPVRRTVIFFISVLFFITISSKERNVRVAAAHRGEWQSHLGQRRVAT
jgi:hypothetical protein